jgi:hypothetical protein
MALGFLEEDDRTTVRRARWMRISNERDCGPVAVNRTVLVAGLRWVNRTSNRSSGSKKGNRSAHSMAATARPVK